MSLHTPKRLRSRERGLVLAMVAARILAPGQRSAAALRKVSAHTLDDQTPAHSFATLLAELSTIVRNTCRTPGNSDDTSTFELLTMPNAKQQHALKLLQSISV